MSLRVRRSRERRQWLGRLLLRLTLLVLVLAGITALGAEAYRTGSRLALAETERLAGELESARAEVERLQQGSAKAQAERDAAQADTEAARARYAADVPTGVLAALLGDLRARLAGGSDPAVLAGAIRVAAPVLRCEGPPVVRRFRINAGERPGPEDTATFLDGLIRVQASATQGFENIARTIQLGFAGIGMEGEPRNTGMPATRIFRLGQFEFPVTVGPSPIVGFAQASMATCRVE